MELNTNGPLEAGAPREGWLHFRVRNINPAQYNSAGMELAVEDSLGAANVVAVTGTRYLSGKAERNELGDPPHVTLFEKQAAST